MDAVTLARAQFAFTIGYHILWPTFTIGLACFVTLLSGLVWRTGNPLYRDMMRFWTRIFAMTFGMGVITGVVLSYEIGTNWSGFSRSVSNVLGPLFMYEALTAFFLEAGFIGIVLFGGRRVGPGMHFFASCMVALGSVLSAGWIIAANSWMQTPAGAVADAAGIFHAVDWWEVVFSPSFPYRVLHMLCASFVTCAFVIAGISAFHLWRKPGMPAARAAFSMAMWMALIATPTQIVLGDFQGRNTLEYQPTKLAAMEGLWDTGSGVPMTVFAWPNMQTASNDFAIDVPHLASLYLTHSWNGTVQGLKAVPPSDWPNVPIVFFAFRVMVGIGMLLLAIAITGAVLRWRGVLYERRWFLFTSMLVSPLGFVAVLAGWTTTEAGRQPYIVYGMLRTADAVSPVSVGAVATTLLGFIVIYDVLLIVFLWFLAKVILKGPEDAAPPDAALHPGMDNAAPSVLGVSLPASTPAAPKQEAWT